MLVHCQRRQKVRLASKKKFADVQCSETQIFVLTDCQVFVFDNVASALQKSKKGTNLELSGSKVRGLPGPGLFRTNGVKAMGIGPKHAAFVTHKGELYCVGANKYGQCGVPPPKRKGPPGAFEEREEVFQTTPVKVDLPEGAKPLVNVAAGARHTIAMDSVGELFSFGDDTKIQLGLGDTRTGGYDERHAFGTYSMSQSGGVPVKGDIQKQVSYRFYDQHMQFSPVQTLHPPAYNRPPYPAASHIVCGDEFNVAVHRDSPDWYSDDQMTNVLFCCGENMQGQCGRNLQQQQQTWNTVRLPKRCRTVGLSCGSGHCLALLKTGELYGWGLNGKGQVGAGGRHMMRGGVPQRIKVWGVAEEGEPEIPEGTVRNIACGFQNSAVICDPVDPLVQQSVSTSRSDIES